MSERRYIIRPEDADQGWRIAKLAADGLRQAAREARDTGKPVEALFRPWSPPRTDPQRNTMWKWHGEVASELTVRTGKRWTKEDVHEVIFIPRFMPQHEALIDPTTGEVVTRNKRTSEATKAEISEAMTAYLAWIYEMGIEATVPLEGTW